MKSGIPGAIYRERYEYMKSRELSLWMWGDALSLLEQAERLRRQFVHTFDTRCWEPPVDVVEDEDGLFIHIALPGVPQDAIFVSVDADGITVSGLRRFPAQQASRIHRIEIPYGRFERRIPLPLHALEPVSRELAHGCLMLHFKKVKESP